MPDEYISQQDILKSCLDWLEQNRPALEHLYIGKIKALPDNFFGRLSPDELQTFAATNVAGIIARMRGVQISMERTEHNLFGFFERGATLNDLNQVIDSFQQAFLAYVAKDKNLPGQCQNFLAEKMAYMKSAYSTVISLVMLKYQNQLKRI